LDALELLSEGVVATQAAEYSVITSEISVFLVVEFVQRFDYCGLELLTIFRELAL